MVAQTKFSPVICKTINNWKVDDSNISEAKNDWGESPPKSPEWARRRILSHRKAIWKKIPPRPTFFVDMLQRWDVPHTLTYLGIFKSLESLCISLNPFKNHGQKKKNATGLGSCPGWDSWSFWLIFFAKFFEPKIETLSASWCGKISHKLHVVRAKTTLQPYGSY